MEVIRRWPHPFLIAVRDGLPLSPSCYATESCSSEIERSQCPVGSVCTKRRTYFIFESYVCILIISPRVWIELWRWSSESWNSEREWSQNHDERTATAAKCLTSVNVSEWMTVCDWVVGVVVRPRLGSCRHVTVHPRWHLNAPSGPSHPPLSPSVASSRITSCIPRSTPVFHLPQSSGFRFSLGWRRAGARRRDAGPLRPPATPSSDLDYRSFEAEPRNN